MDPASRHSQAIFLKAHLRMFAVGMRNSQLSGTDVLKKATAVTGKAYKRGQYNTAIEDLKAVIDEELAAASK
jgi:hypothetical protein